ncbi:MAG TPA: AAA family ATPase [Pseudonocardiaceae bacterium]|nr:AAA family ATPase [Pseudonocardiaceae bacterium]
MDSANPRSRSALVGREAALSRITEVATRGSAAPLIVIAGPIGIGRSSVLALARDRLADLGVSTLAFRVARNERNRPYAVASRLSAELGALPRADSAEGRRAVGTTSLETHSATAGRLAGALSAAMTTHRRLAVFLDDLQWIDAGSLTALVPLVRTLVGTSITFVCTLRSPLADSAAGRAALAGLREAGLAELITLRPLHRAEVDALVTAELEAKPSSTLSESLQRSCRGVPAAVLAALEGHRRTDSMRIVDRHAYLAWPSRPPELATDLPMFEHLRQLGAPAWPVVKALAVLHPLGDVAARLIAEAVGLHESEVTEVLAGLREEGVLRHGPKPGFWRFRLPLLADSLTACLGPYERRRLSQLAVTAIWEGGVSSDDHYLAEQLVTAGKLVDPERAANELLARGAGAMLDNGYFAERWLRAAVDLITEPGQRAWALFLHAATCCIHLQFPDAVDSAWTVLSGYADLLTPEAVLELEMIYVVALSGTFDTEALTNIAEEGWRTLPGGEGHRVVTRCAALCHLDRWLEADEQFESNREIWRNDNAAVAAFGLIFAPGTAAFLGRMAEFNGFVADPSQRPLWDVERHRFEQLSELGRILMSFGELDRANALLGAHDVPIEQRPVPDRVVVAALGGRWNTALDLARVSLATGSSLGYVPAHTVMCREMSIILTARGRLAQARTVIENVYTDQPVLTHLLAAPEAELERTLGADDRAKQLLTDGLALAAEHGLVVGTDELWLRMTEWHLAAGEPEQARRAAAEVARVAELIETGRARLHGLLATAITEEDGAAAAEAVGLARQRSQPFELANTLSLLAGRGLIEGKLLREAYELYGELDALLPRARLRHVMRERDIAVPGRSATVAENERLLAALVTEGLTNRELAIVLGGSEKSVEGRLSRLFQRTGYRSRVELATAMLTGEYRA